MMGTLHFRGDMHGRPRHIIKVAHAAFANAGEQVEERDNRQRYITRFKDPLL